MPTTRPRHQITETDEVARALDEAARRWPEVVSRAELLRRLVAEGHRVISAEACRDDATRHDAILRTRGVGAGLYGPSYLAELREDWPE